MDYLFHIIVLIGIYSILALSTDILVGQLGLLSICQAAFFGIGAYTSALLAVRAGLPFPVGLIAGGCCAAAASLVVSLPSLRLHDDYFVIATFGFQTIVLGVLVNWIDLTRGPLGIPAIPEPSIFGLSVRSPLAFVILVSGIALPAYWLVRRLASSPFGRVLRAIREDEVFARSLGKNTLRFKVTAFAVSAMLAALGGSLYAHYVTYIDPTSFSVTESILLVSIVIIGGAGSQSGPVLGATLIVLLPEALRLVGLPSSVAGPMRQVAYGVLLVTVLMFLPRGMAGGYDFER
jgi:branched-chain amino acid transport system permease protein